MGFLSIGEACLAALAAALLAGRELWRRLRLRYDYRWETFAVREVGGRQLLHIRQSEISGIEPLSLKDRIWRSRGFKRLSRTSFGRQVVIRSTVAHARPVVVSWEGRPIAGIQPEGYRLGRGEARPEG